MIHGKDTVEVVHFVLDKFGEGAFGFEDAVLTGNTLITKDNAPVAFKADHQIGKGKAVVPELELVAGQPGVFRVHEFIFLTLDFEVDDAAGFADLDGANTSAEPVGTAKLEEGGAKVAEEEAGGGGFGDGFGTLPEEGVSEEQDRAGGHVDFIVSRVGYS